MDDYTTPLLASDYEDPKGLLLGGGNAALAIGPQNIDNNDQHNPEFAKLISQVGNGIVPWGRPCDIENEIYDDDDYEYDVNQPREESLFKNNINNTNHPNYGVIRLSNQELKIKSDSNNDKDISNNVINWKKRKHLNKTMKRNVRQPLVSLQLDSGSTEISHRYAHNNVQNHCQHHDSSHDSYDNDENHFYDNSFLLFEEYNDRQPPSDYYDHHDDNIALIDMHARRNRLLFLKCIILCFVLYGGIIYHSFRISAILRSWTQTNTIMTKESDCHNNSTTPLAIHNHPRNYSSETTTTSWWDHNTNDNATADLSLSSISSYLSATSKMSTNISMMSNEHDEIWNPTTERRSSLYDETDLWNVISLSIHNNNDTNMFSSVYVYSNNSIQSILHNYQEVGLTIDSILLIISTFLIPCFFVIMTPSWIVYEYGIYHNFNENNTNNNGDRNHNIVKIITSINMAARPRLVTELLIRFSMVTVYIFLLLAMVLHNINLTNIPSSDCNTISIETYYQSGFLNYITIITYVSVICVILRLPIPMLCSTNHYCYQLPPILPSNSDNRQIITPKASNITDHHHQSKSDPLINSNIPYGNDFALNQEEVSSDLVLNTSITSHASTGPTPPPHAFQIPWGNKDGHAKNESDNANNLSGDSALISSSFVADRRTNDHNGNQRLPADDEEIDIIHMVVPLEEQAAALSYVSSHNNNNNNINNNNNRNNNNNNRNNEVVEHPQRIGNLVNRTITILTMYDQSKTISFYTLIILLFSGFITVIFLVSLLFEFPLFELKYYGVASSYMKTNLDTNSIDGESTHLIIYYLDDLIRLLHVYNDNISSSYSFLDIAWIRMILCCWIIIIPIISLALCTTIWIIRGWYYVRSRFSNHLHDHCYLCMRRLSYHCRNWLYAIHPVCNGGMILCIAIYMTIYSLELFSSTMMEHDDHDGASSMIWWPFHNQSMICRTLTGAREESCLLVQGQFHLGGWLYFLQSILLEVWIYVTLQ